MSLVEKETSPRSWMMFWSAKTIGRPNDWSSLIDVKVPVWSNTLVRYMLQSRYSARSAYYLGMTFINHGMTFINRERTALLESNSTFKLNILVYYWHQANVHVQGLLAAWRIWPDLCSLNKVLTANTFTREVAVCCYKTVKNNSLKTSNCAITAGDMVLKIEKNSLQCQTD